MRKRRDDSDASSIAFLDVISCGFGAMILLLLITDSSPIVTIEAALVPQELPVSDLQAQLFEIRGETQVVNRDLNAKREQLSAFQDRIANLRRELYAVQGRFESSNSVADERIIEAQTLASAKQSLTDEMQRLLGEDSTRRNNLVGGIPVDSEYIIFVIDTSGSMFQNAWPKLIDTIVNTLDVYPEVKGIQIMNDMGDYMFNSFRGQWIPDTPARRSTIISTLRNWSPFSNSSPVEGVTAAINTYYAPDKKISIYVMGDDFQPGGSITQVLRTIDRLNAKDADGNPMVRIHGVGFPVIFSLEARYHQSAYRFANLMRELTQRNGGTFVGLNSFR
ncbi:MAG: VWA domain-containing protein [Gammaproteobacteria bacterium]|nr:VWA domain-containing protein [Gammaproteobacteria bacterium]MDP2346498.1 VWA domain-containing protein [Gammaproteobacteria bacterium]